MSETRIRHTRILEDDARALDEAIASGFDRPLLLWGHPEIGQAAIIAAAAEAAGRPVRTLGAQQLKSWEELENVSASGHFRQISLDAFLEKGERGDPLTFAPAPGEVLVLEGLNEVPTATIEAIFAGILDEGRLMNNLLPAGVRIIATAWPRNRKDAVDLLGPALSEVWSGMKQHADLKYPVQPLPERVLERCEHWAIRPSTTRFIAWGRRQHLAEEVLGFLEDIHGRDPALALFKLHAALVHPSGPFPAIASPRSFAEFGSLLSERRLYFSSRAVKRALAAATGADSFLDWLHAHIASWDPERWIHCDAILTLRGEPVPGSLWLRHLRDAVGRGESRVTLEDLPTYATFERSSLVMWATQELGDEIGEEFLAATTLSADEVRRLGA